MNGSIRRMAIAGAAVGVLVLGGTSVAWAVPAVSHALSGNSDPSSPSNGSSHGGRSHRGGPPALRGTVSVVGTGTFTITESDGTSQVIDTTATTVYSETGTKTVPSGVAVGQQVSVLAVHMGTGGPGSPPSSTSSTTSTTAAAVATPVTAARVTIVLAQAGGTVTAVTPASFTLEGMNGLAQIVNVTGTTIYSDGATTITAVTVGQHVSAFGTADATTPSQLDALFVDVFSGTSASGGAPGGPGNHVGPPGLHGSVSAVGTDSFTITEGNGTSQVIDTTATTVYSESGTSTAPTGVAVGDEVSVMPVGNHDSDPDSTTTTTASSPVVAARVQIDLAQVGGSVTAVTPTSFTVEGFNGLQQVVNVSASTVYSDGTTTITAVTVGQQVSAFGTADVTDPTQLDALFVNVQSGTASSGGPGSASGGGPGGVGGGFGNEGAPGGTSGVSDGSQGGSGAGGTPTTNGTNPPRPNPGSGTLGRVTTISGDTISITEQSGTVVAVVVSDATTYSSPSGKVTVADIAVGDVISVTGTTDALGNLDATAVLICGPGQGGPSNGDSTSGSTPPTDQSGPSGSIGGQGPNQGGPAGGSGGLTGGPGGSSGPGGTGGPSSGPGSGQGGIGGGSQGQR